MSNLIYEIHTFKPRARTIFNTSLKIYEDFVVIRERKWFKVSEYTITYKHIARAHLESGILFATLQIMDSTGNDNAQVKYVWKKEALKAKKIIDQKINLTHTGETSRKELKSAGVEQINNLEKSLIRLRELVNKGKISEKEYEKRKKKMIESMS